MRHIGRYRHCTEDHLDLDVDCRALAYCESVEVDSTELGRGHVHYLYTEVNYFLLSQDCRARACLSGVNRVICNRQIHFRILTWSCSYWQYEVIIVMNDKTDEIIVIIMQMSSISAFPFLCYIWLCYNYYIMQYLMYGSTSMWRLLVR